MSGHRAKRASKVHAMPCRVCCLHSSHVSSPTIVPPKRRRLLATDPPTHARANQHARQTDRWTENRAGLPLERSEILQYVLVRAPVRSPVRFGALAVRVLLVLSDSFDVGFACLHPVLLVPHCILELLDALVRFGETSVEVFFARFDGRLEAQDRLGWIGAGCG